VCRAAAALLGCCGCVDFTAAALLACWLGDAVGAAVVEVSSPGAPADDDAGDWPAPAATMMISGAARDSTPVSTLCRAIQDQRRRGGRGGRAPG
jgi:hypothetical protein